MLNYFNSYYAKIYLFMFVVFNQYINQVMKKRSYYFCLSNSHLVKVSCLRFYLRKWFHFPISDFRLCAIHHYPNCLPIDLVLVWIPVLQFDKN